MNKEKEKPKEKEKEKEKDTKGLQNKNQVYTEKKLRSLNWMCKTPQDTMPYYKPSKEQIEIEEQNLKAKEIKAKYSFLSKKLEEQKSKLH